MGALFGPREARDSWTAVPVVPPLPGWDVMGVGSLRSRPEQAMFLSTVWACVSLVANAISCLPLQTFRQAGPVPARITDPQIVKNPTAGQPQGEWLLELLVSLLIYGNAYGRKVGMSGLGFPQQVVLLDPRTVTVKQDRTTGAVSYFAGADRQDITGDMWHVKGLTQPGAPTGMSPVLYAADTIGLDQAARKFALDFFQAGGLPVSVLESDQPINQEQATTLKQRLVAATRNREPAVLGSGTKLSAGGVKPDESQFLETQQTNIARIAQFFGVPAEMVGGKTGSSLTYNTVEMNNQMFLDQAIRPWLRRIEDAFFELLPQPQFVQFDVSQLLRTDAESQAKVNAILVAAKIKPPSRFLQAMGEPPLTDTEKQELEMVPLGVNPGTGLPKGLPNPPTPATADDVPDVQTGKPKLEAVNG